MGCTAESVIAALRDLVTEHGGCTEGELFTGPAALAPIGDVMVTAIRHGVAPSELFR